MTHISSRPSRKALGDYSFYIDIDGKNTDEKVEKAMSEIIKLTPMCKYLGTYPKG